MEYVQQQLFPNNANNKIFIYPKSLKNKLPAEIMNCIKPSMKAVHNYTLHQLQDINNNFNDNFMINIYPKLNSKLIHQLSHCHLKTCTLSESLKFENHLFSDENIQEQLHYLLHHFKYENPDLTSHKIDLESFYGKCNIETLLYYEYKYNVKLLIIDKLLGIAIVNKHILRNIASKETNSILVPISYEYKPYYIKHICINYAYEFQSILDDFKQIPNKSLTILINDIKSAKNGCFQFNPLYKANKFKQETPSSPKVHDPRIRLVISGINSPLAPILKLISKICIFLIYVIQNEFNITNIVEDSYHVISNLTDYLNSSYDVNDNLVIFDFTSFYTELPYDFIQNKLTKLYHIFNLKYLNTSNNIYKIYAKMVLAVQKGYKIASKYCVINIDGKLYKQKEGVIMGASAAPNLSNLSILINLIKKNIQK